MCAAILISALTPTPTNIPTTTLLRHAASASASATVVYHTIPLHTALGTRSSLSYRPAPAYPGQQQQQQQHAAAAAAVAAAAAGGGAFMSVKECFPGGTLSLNPKP